MKYKKFIHGLSVLVKKKFIPMTRINDAVKRILRVKFMMGLFENPLADLSMAKYLGCKVSILVVFYIKPAASTLWRGTCISIFCTVVC